MNINKVTITGADNKVAQDELMFFTKSYPFVEWGILFSLSREGSNRYPTLDWMDKLLQYDLDLSGHFCGWWSQAILERQEFGLIEILDKKFKRVQLNYNFKNRSNWDLLPLIEFAKSSDKQIILQYNKSNSDTLNSIIDIVPSNIHFLFDSSGGRGTEIKEVQQPFKNYTGYSGGLSIQNIDSICTKIVETQNESTVWIDLESGARTEDEFDLLKVKELLEKTSLFVNKNN